MAEWYYTDSWNRQYGPVADSVLLELNQTGAITARNSVWREGMDTWEPFHTVAPELFENDEEGNPINLGICAYSGRVLSSREMVPYGDAMIGVDSREEFVQSLMETGRVVEAQTTTKEREYIGFWWRTLGVMLDEMVKYGLMAILLAVLALIFFGTMKVFSVPTQGGAFTGIFMAFAMLIAYGAGAVYEIWMVGKYQGTLGKMVIGAKIVQPDHSRVTYKRSVGRWFAKTPIFLEGVKILPYVMFGFFIGLVSSGFQSGSTAFLIASWFLAFALPTILSIVLTSVFWMAAFDEQKRAFHDRIASTRVVPK